MASVGAGPRAGHGQQAGPVADDGRAAHGASRRSQEVLGGVRRARPGPRAGPPRRGAWRPPGPGRARGHARAAAMTARTRACASATPRPGRAPGSRSQAQVEALGGADELDGQDALGVLEDAAQVEGRDRAHRDVVLLVGRGGDGVGRGRVRQHLRLRGQGGRRVLQDHEPRIEAGRGAQEGRQPVVEARVEEQRHAPLADGAQLGDGQLGQVERQGHRLAVEVAAADDEAVTGRQGVLGHVAALGEDERIVGGGVHLDVEDAVQVVQGVAGGAVDLRHAADRVGVLDAVAVGVVRALQLAVAQQPAQLGGGAHLAGVRDGWTGRRR